MDPDHPEQLSSLPTLTPPTITPTSPRIHALSTGSVAQFQENVKKQLRLDSSSIDRSKETSIDLRKAMRMYERKVSDVSSQNQNNQGKDNSKESNTMFGANQLSDSDSDTEHDNDNDNNNNNNRVNNSHGQCTVSV